MPRGALGAKVKSRRKALGLTQAGLARQIGVSGSYVNLIENGRRAVGGALLKRIATALETDLEALDVSEERRLMAALDEIAAEPVLRGARPERDDLGALVERHPGWARALLLLQSAYADRDRAARTLSDRLNHDPFLKDGVHRMIGHVSAIRSASEILSDMSDLTGAQIQRFNRMIGDESGHLADLTQALAAFFAKGDAERSAVTPAEEVDDFIAARRNYFPSLEDAGDRLRIDARLETAALDAALAERLRRGHGLTVALVDPPQVALGEFARGLRIDASSGRVEQIATAPLATRRFELARLLAEREAGPEIEEIVASDPRLRSAQARRRAASALASYAAAATLTPYARFLEQAETLRYDLDALANRFSVSVEQAAHRLASLRRPGAEGVPFGFIRVDPSGFVTKRLALPGMPLPRLGGACPLWALYRAFQTPGRTIAQLAAFSEQERYVLIARTQEKIVGALGPGRHLVSIQLACEEIHSDRIAYVAGAPEPVGATCRLCSREACPARQEEIVGGA